MTEAQRIDEKLGNAVTILADIRVTRRTKESQFRDWLRNSLADDEQAANDVLRLLIEKGLIPERPDHNCGDPNCIHCARPKNAEDGDDDDDDEDTPQMHPALKGILSSMGLGVIGPGGPKPGTVAMTEGAAPNPVKPYHFLIGDCLVVVTAANSLQYSIEVTPLTRVL